MKPKRILLALLLASAGLSHSWAAGFFETHRYELVSKELIIRPDGNFSGITYNPLSKSLFIVDDQGFIYEVSKDGKSLRTITLKGFDDPEGIDRIGPTEFALVEEERGELVLIKILPGTREIFKTGSRSYAIEPSYNNNGIDGVAYVAAKKSFFMVKEAGPKKVFSVKIAGLEPVVFTPFDGELLPLKNLSDIVFNPALSPSLFILSNRSKRLIEVGKSGEVLSSMGLLPFMSEGKPDGFTFDDEGTLYVVVEGVPNKENFYCFKSPTVKKLLAPKKTTRKNKN